MRMPISCMSHKSNIYGMYIGFSSLFAFIWVSMSFLVLHMREDHSKNRRSQSHIAVQEALQFMIACMNDNR